MTAGLEVYDQSGRLTYSSEWGAGRILGRFTVTSTSGSKTMVTEQGDPIQRLFAYSVPFDRLHVSSRSTTDKVRFAIWTNLNTIYWQGVPVGRTIVYGDCFV